MTTYSGDISMDQLASVLLKNNFYLTALELHTELCENGSELPLLRDFFSNPSNFEQTTMTSTINTLHKTPSTQTFDSLDWTRYSDDIDKDKNENDKVVLEFELRKAKETINKLRNTLTMATSEQDCVDLTKSFATIRSMNNGELRDNLTAYNESILPHEKSALNYLVNEYLLSEDFKMTSVTFAEENESQDLEDWDFVGLNRAKPPNILSLYRYYYNKNEISRDQIRRDDIKIEKFDIGNQISLDKEFISNQEAKMNELIEKQAFLFSKIDKLQQEIENLKNEKDILLKRIEFFSLNQNGDLCAENVLEANETEIKTERKLPSLFEELICKFFSKKLSEENEVIVKDLYNIRSNYNSLLSILTKYLPIILPNILIQKRNELLPLIVSTAIVQTNASDRDLLLKLIFDLVKKPDSEQRSIILEGCISYARQTGAQRTTNELLPQFWEQINNKHEEKRCLVAESCACLAPFVIAEIRSSLMLSMLKQILTSDNSEEVRICATKSLGVLINYIQNDDKFNECIDLLNQCLNDTIGVQTSAYSLVLPSVCLWATSMRKLFEPFLSDILRKLSLEQSRDELKKQINLLKHLVNYIYACVLIDVDAVSEYKVPKGDYYFCNGHSSSQKSKAQSIQNDLYSLNVIIDCNLNDYKNSFDYLIVNNQWNISLKWIENNFLKSLINMTALVEVSDFDLTQELIELFTRICLTFDHHFSNKILAPLFKMFIDKSENLNNMNILSKATLPVYFCGCLSVCFNECKFNRADENDLFNDHFKELSAYLNDLIVKYAENSLKIDALMVIFQQLNTTRSDKNCYLQLLLSTLWHCVVHTSSSVRCYTAQLFECILKYVHESVLSSRVLPALITLANDHELHVRLASISTLASIIETVKNKDIIERVYAQLQTFSSDSNATDALLRAYKRIVLKVDAKFREEHILLFLSTLVNQILQSLYSPTSQKMNFNSNPLLILDIYNTLACINLPPKCAQERLLPNLNSLKQILYADSHVNNDAIKLLNNLINEFEIKYGQNFKQNDVAMTNTDNNFKTIMFKGLTSSKEKFSFLLNKKH